MFLTHFFFLLQEMTRLTDVIPTELGNLENLVRIFLSKWMSLNQMYMMIQIWPSEVLCIIFCACALICEIFNWIAANSLRGPIPSELGNLKALEFLKLGKLFASKLFAIIKKKFEYSISVTYLCFWSVPSYYFEDENDLTGQLPSELGNLEALLTMQLGKFI